MSAPWFEPNLYAWIPGTALGVLGGTWGSLCGVLAQSGKARAFVVGGAAVLLAASVGLLGVAIYALTQGQPYGIWYGLGLPGVIGTIMFSMFLPMSRRVYAQAEMRRMQARDAAL